MICLYCKYNTISSSCLNCNVQIFLKSDGSPELIGFNLGDYTIDLDIRYNMTKLYYDDPIKDFSYDPVLSLPYLIDINPSNKQYWLSKLISLIPFV